jgi:hypothetical protein
LSSALGDCASVVPPPFLLKPASVLIGLARVMAQRRDTLPIVTAVNDPAAIQSTLVWESKKQARESFNNVSARNCASDRVIIAEHRFECNFYMPMRCLVIKTQRIKFPIAVQSGFRNVRVRVLGDYHVPAGRSCDGS